MKVWVLEQSDYDCFEVLGVFKTPSAARAACELDYLEREDVGLSWNPLDIDGDDWTVFANQAHWTIRAFEVRP